MAKKKPPKQKPDEPKTDLTKWGKQPVLFQVRGRPEYKEALQDLMASEGIKSFADLVDRALRAYTREIRYSKTLPKR